MQRFFRRLAVGALVVLLSAAGPSLAAQAGWRQITVPASARDQEPIAVTLHYPTEAVERSLTLGPIVAHVAPQAPPEPAFKGLVAISHGLGGSAVVHESLAEALARAGYLVATLRHSGDNFQDDRLVRRGPAAYFDERPRQVSRVLDALLADPQWGERIASDALGPRIAAVGHSAGGYTVLALSGGRPDMTRLQAHCDQNRQADPIFCARAGSSPPSTSATGAAPADPAPLRDRRVRVVVALAPVGAVFDPGSLAAIAVPVSIYVAASDRYLVPRFHGQWVAAQMPTATLHLVPNAWHFAFIDTPSTAIPSADGDLRDDPPGFDRAALLRQLQSEVPAFIDAAFTATAAP